MLDNIGKDKEVAELLSRYISKAYPSSEYVAQQLQSGKKLTFYFGIDPTGPDLHLGHSVGLLVMRKLSLLGHSTIILFGDFTAQIGDPTDKDATRKQLSFKEVKENVRTYKDQLKKVMRGAPFKIARNADWHKKLSFEDVIKLASNISVQQLITRDMFQKRLQEGKSIGLHEFLYPLMQGYDSVVMRVDGEVGGHDQTFNMLVGRDLEKRLLDKDKIVLATKFLEDPATGKKLMNKSEGTYIAVCDSPQSMFGKVMALPDSAILPLFEFATEVPLSIVDDIKTRLATGENPKTLKLELAVALVSMYSGDKNAIKARDEFQRIFAKGEVPENAPEIEASGKDLVIVLVEWLKISNSEAKRLINDRAIKINQEIVTDWKHRLAPGDDLRVGSHRFAKIK